MDPIAHTLVGASLAQTGLKRLSTYATSVLVVGANIPDVDAVVTIMGADSALWLRRGVTHGVLAMVLWPFIMVAGVYLWHRFMVKRRGRDLEDPHYGFLLLLAAIAVLSHPFLDWLNTYGVRALMPFSQAWFYGDALFIIDPWMWLMMGASVVLITSGKKSSAALWIVFACFASGLILFSGYVPVLARIAWFLGVTLVIILRLRKLHPHATAILARTMIALLALYIVLMIFASRQTTQIAYEHFATEHTILIGPIATPRPANPFSRDVILLFDEEEMPVWREFPVHWPSGRIDPPIVERPLYLTNAALTTAELDDITSRALALPEVKGIANWLRAPIFAVNDKGDHWEVHITDMRYSSRDTAGFAENLVRLPKDVAK